MKHYKAAFFEVFEEEKAFLKKFLPEEYNYLFMRETIQETGYENPPAKIISTRTQSEIPEEWAKKLTGIITRSTGYDHILDFFERAGETIPAAYLPNYAARAVAEQAMLIWTALLRKLPSQITSFYTFQRDNITGYECENTTITIIGVGNIGTQIVKIAHGLGMEIIGVDINPNLQLAKKYQFSFLPLSKALKQSKIAVCALPLTNQTRGLLNYKTLKLMPRHSIFINIARGEISPIRDLLRLIKEKHLSGLGLDVYTNEKELAMYLRTDKVLLLKGFTEMLKAKLGIKICLNNIVGDKYFPKTTSIISREANVTLQTLKELISHPNVICTPHNAFNTFESVERKAQKTVENFISFIKTGTFVTPIRRNEYE